MKISSLALLCNKTYSPLLTSFIGLAMCIFSVSFASTEAQSSSNTTNVQAEKNTTETKGNLTSIKKL